MGKMQHNKGEVNHFTGPLIDPLLSAFMRFFHIEELTNRFSLLVQMASVFALLPYENPRKSCGTTLRLGPAVPASPSPRPCSTLSER